MNDRYEYISTLEKALVGRLDPDELRDIVTYYKDYINAEIVKGKKEELVLESLGEPKLLAKSILAAHSAEGEAGTEVMRTEKMSWWDFFKANPSILVGLIVALLILLFIIGIVFAILNALWPVILALIVFGIVTKIFGKKK